METVLIFSLFFVWKSFVLRRMAMERRRIRLQKARMQIEIIRQQLRQRRAMVALTAAASMASFPVERRFWVSSSRY